MIKVIVNADDYGWDENRTKAILEAYRLGAITTTTVMVNMPWFEKSIELAKENGLFKNIGLHLCLTEGRPLTDMIKSSRLFCDKAGNFTGMFHKQAKWRLWLPPFERKAVREEIEAQMALYVETKIPMMHLDSHHHAHTDFSIAQIVLPMAQEFGFKTVRLSRNLGKRLSVAKRVYKYFFNEYQRRYLQPNAEHFCSFDDFISRRSEIPDETVVEVMTHPLYQRVGKLMLNGELMEGKDGRVAIRDIRTFWRDHATSIRLCPFKEEKAK